MAATRSVDKRASRKTRPNPPQGVAKQRQWRSRSALPKSDEKVAAKLGETGGESETLTTEGNNAAPAQAHVASRDVDPDEDILYGLISEQVRQDVAVITDAISEVVHSVDTLDFELILPSLDASDQNSELFELLQTAKIPAVTSIDSFLPFLKAALASAVWNWTFYPEGRTDAANTNPRREALLEAFCQTSLPERKLNVDHLNNLC